MPTYDDDSLPAPSARAVGLHGRKVQFMRTGVVRDGAGLSDDTPLAARNGWHRAMRLFGGPGEVRLRSIARGEQGREPVPPRGGTSTGGAA